MIKHEVYRVPINYLKTLVLDDQWDIKKSMRMGQNQFKVAFLFLYSVSISPVISPNFLHEYFISSRENQVLKKHMLKDCFDLIRKEL